MSKSSYYQLKVLCIQLNFNHPKSVKVWFILPTLPTRFLLINLKDELKKILPVEIQFSNAHRQRFLLQFSLDSSVSQRRRFLPSLLDYFGIIFRYPGSLSWSRFLIL